MNSSKDNILSIKDATTSEVGIILGARVHYKGLLSDILRDRTQTAINLYHSGKIKKILMSGDNGSIYYDEVTPVKKYLIKNKIPEDKIFLDYAGFDTYDTMYRAKNIFSVENAIVITQKFHLPRALFLCKKVGIKCSGTIADKQKYTQEKYVQWREYFANVKALFDVLFNSKPKFLGEKVDMTKAQESPH